MAAQFNSHKMVDDELVVQIVLDRLRSLDKLSSHEKEPGTKMGYILNGFPRTRYQALMLQRAGLIPDKTFFINVDKDSVIFSKVDH